MYTTSRRQKQLAITTVRRWLENRAYEKQNHNANLDAFNVNPVFFGWFAPGSEVSFVRKKAVIPGAAAIPNDYFRNLERVVGSLQRNSLSLKILYCLNALMLQTLKKSRQSDNGLM